MYRAPKRSADFERRGCSLSRPLIRKQSSTSMVRHHLAHSWCRSVDHCRDLREWSSKSYPLGKLQQTIHLEQKVHDCLQQNLSHDRRYCIPDLLLDARGPKFVTPWEALQASELAGCVVPLPARMDDATTTGSYASSNFVPRLWCVLSLFRQVDIMIGPPVRDLGNSSIDRSPRFQTCLFGVGRMGRFWERGQIFARAAERKCQHSMVTIVQQLSRLTAWTG